MKVKDICKQLQHLDQDTELCILDFNGKPISVENIYVGNTSIDNDYSFKKTKHYLLTKYIKHFEYQNVKEL